jgi:hypothetical protein
MVVVGDVAPRMSSNSQLVVGTLPKFSKIRFKINKNNSPPLACLQGEKTG